MQTSRVLCAVLMVMMLASLALAQTATAAPAAQPAAGGNPVITTVRGILDRQERNLTGAADAMPADKYDFKPTDDQLTFAHVISHVVNSNAVLCERIGDQPAPQALKDVKETDGKDKLVVALKQSFDYCRDALQRSDDSKLGDQVTGFRGNKVARAAAVIGLTNDFADHYAQLAMYLRLNKILPPSAQPRRP